MMKKILVPTDFSKCAEHAVEVAAQIAKKTNARLIIMHIVNLPSYSSNDSFNESQDTAESLFYMKLVKKRFAELFQKPFLEGVNALELIDTSAVYESILFQEKEQEVDMIVMRSHGTAGAEEVFIGSNTERVIRRAEVPVLTVKRRNQNFSPKSMVFASNFHEESYTIFHKVKSFAEVFETEIKLLKINTPGSFETTRYSNRLMDDFAEKMHLDNYTTHIYNDDKIENGIHHFAQDHKADIIAMETHGRTGIRHLLMGSITEGVANHSDLPVLSVRIPKSAEPDGVIFPD